MKRRWIAVAFLACWVFPGAKLEAQDTNQNEAVQVLTLDEAVTTALGKNRLVKNAQLEAEKFDFRVHSIRTKRLPEFHVSALELQLLKPVDFTFRQGVFGTFPGLGPIPGIDTVIKTPARPSTFALGSIMQPLSQQHKIGLGIHVQELERDIAREDLRAERQKIAAEVRSVYVSLVATQSGVDAAQEAVTTLREAKQTASRYEAERAILKADVLQIEARLAKQEYQLSVAQSGLATQREHLNQLMGRDIGTAFRVSFTPEIDPSELALDEARRRALESRPEVRQARLRAKQAEYARRIAKAEYIPDVSLAVGYLGIRSIEVIQNNAAAAGIYLSWEPFDWGRKRDSVSEKSKTLEQARNGITETESQVAVEVGLKYRKWKDSSLLLAANRAAQEAAAEQLRVINNKFKEQAVLVKDLLQAQAQSADADYQYQEALSQYWSALADLRKAMGEE